MKLNLFDTNQRLHLLPLTFTRPQAALRVGILTIAEKWQKHLPNAEIGYICEPYLSEKYARCLGDVDVLINGSVLPTNELVETILALEINQGLKTSQNEIVALKGDLKAYEGDENLIEWQIVEAELIRFPEDIFSKNEAQLRADFELITKGRQSAPLSNTNQVLSEGSVFLEKGAKIEGSLLNPQGGVIYLAVEAEIMPGCMITGSVAIGDHSVLKMGAKIYGATTLGPHCKVGGEVNNSVIFGYSSKAHDGFLGNSVIGEWCNLGADTNNSNLKNNYAEVKLWDYPTSRFRNTGLLFCGLIMGDHSKCGINTMFNTGTVVGVSANIFGAGFPRNFIPSFAWGGSSGFSTYQLSKAFETAELVYGRRGMELNTVEKGILSEIFNDTAHNRFWENNKTITI